MQHRNVQNRPSLDGYDSQTIGTTVDSMLPYNIHHDSKGCTDLSHDDHVDPSQLITLAEKCLNEKGPLPVGEVGKLLQEATGNPNLSQALKEKYGGLKKFLETYSDIFIMSCDHPFNPHLYLRRLYAPEAQQVIERGSTLFLETKQKVGRSTTSAHSSKY